MMEAIGFGQILGHPKPVATLLSARRKGALAHAYLFEGPEGVGKRRTAMALFAALQCDEQRPDACGTCPSCQKVAAGNHPDIHVVVPEGKAQIIKIDMVREITRKVAYPAMMGRWKCVLFDGACRFNEAAGNALLKTLEEPSSNTLFVLSSPRPQLVLSTLVSRCQRIHFHALERHTIAQWLMGNSGLAAAEADVVAGMAEGSIGRATGLVDEALLASRAQWFARAAGLRGASVAELLNYAEELGQSREQLEPALELLRMFYRDVLVLAAGGPPTLVTNRDFEELLVGAAKVVGHRGALGALEMLEEVSDSLRVNANPKLLAEHLLISLAGIN
jgi:DNA polymerase-3 subunit delta'